MFDHHGYNTFLNKFFVCFQTLSNTLMFTTIILFTISFKYIDVNDHYILYVILFFFIISFTFCMTSLYFGIQFLYHGDTDHNLRKIGYFACVGIFWSFVSFIYTTTLDFSQWSIVLMFCSNMMTIIIQSLVAIRFFELAFNNSNHKSIENV